MISLLFKFVSYSCVKKGFHWGFLLGKQESLKGYTCLYKTCDWTTGLDRSLSCLVSHTLDIYIYDIYIIRTYLIAKLVKNLPVIQEILVWFLGQKDLLEKRKATHSSILAWRIPWTTQSQRVGHNWVTYIVHWLLFLWKWQNLEWGKYFI